MSRDTIGIAITAAQILNEPQRLSIAEAKQKSLELLEKSGIVMLGSINDKAFPNIKGMIKSETDGLKHIWFSTCTSSKRVAQFRENPKACVYAVDFNNWEGLMLVGYIEILNDPESKQRLWREGCEVYYPLGVSDPNYSVLKFTAQWGNYYHGLANVSFEVEN